VLNKICFINIFRAKTRSLLTVSAIAVGVFAVVLISAAGTACGRSVSKTLETMGINSILVQNENTDAPGKLNDLDISAISRVSGVSKAMPLMTGINRTRMLDKSVNCITWGINADAREIISLEAKHGRLITNRDTTGKKMVCVIDEGIALATYGRSNVVGKTARVLLAGSYRDFEIVGVAKSGISALQSALSGIIPDFVYIPITTMQMITGRLSYDRIAVLIGAENTDDLAVIDLINGVLTENKGENSGLTVANLLKQKKGLESIMNTITLVLSLIAGISLVVSGLTVMTTMLVSVNERTREIGIKKSIGAKDFDIAKEFLLESVILSGLGSVIGTILGLSVSALGCFIFRIGFAPDFTPILSAIAVSVSLGAVFGGYPAIKAARMEPIEALRAN